MIPQRLLFEVNGKETAVKVGERVILNGSEFEIVQIRGSELHHTDGRKNLAKVYRRAGVSDLVCKERVENGEDPSYHILRERSDGSVEYVSKLE